MTRFHNSSLTMIARVLWKKCIHLVFIQLFLAVVSLPILIAWGLPFSLMSVVGNLLFLPFFVVFLLASSLLFFSELLGLPNGILATSIDTITDHWLSWLSQGHRTWLVTCPAPSTSILMLMALIPLGLIHHKKIRTLPRRIAALAVLLSAFLTYLGSCVRPKTIIWSVPCSRGTVTLIHHHDQTVLIEPGCLTLLENPRIWINRTLIPSLHQTIGSSIIDHAIFLKPGIRTFKAAQHLAQIASLAYVYVPTWHGKTDRKTWSSFRAMHHLVHEHNGAVIRITDVPLAITLDTCVTLSITPHESTRSALRYHDISVTGTVGTTFIDIHPLEYKRTQNR